ncbi:recombinase family protein [Gymnodinialimonas ceratoperidinii]|uniref:Recombinase family protein n=1 Tax=Gymnodinialimonas ceratoperidinii TaxID=2856823 RepID=A0A8F6TYA2_9RHOB|nr:recombinase family protein [Gymnodinialimonas ceratoperidinii]
MSTQKQGEGVSLEAQKDAIQAFAARSNLTVSQWFEEKETAAKSGRPIFNAMLKELRRGRATGLIMHKIDRSARNLRDWATIHELSDTGIDVHFATETLDFRSRGGRLTADIQAVIAADYIRNLREECIKGLQGRLRQGLYPFRAPIGYLDNGRGKPKTPDPIKAPLIRKLFELYASGQHSLRTLQTESQRIGLTNLAGHKLSLHGVETILNNPFYTGLIEIKRTGVTYPGNHTPIISARLFKDVQDIKSGKSGPKLTRHNHLFMGLFRCGHCSGPMSPEKQKGQVYYRCQRPLCPTKTLREDVIEGQVLQALCDLQIDQAEAQRLEDLWLSEAEKNAHRDHLRSLELRLAETEARLNRLTDLLIDGSVDKDTFNERKKSLTLERERLREGIAKTPQLDERRRNQQQFLELMKTLAGLYEIAKPPEKRVLVENVFSNRRVMGKSVELEPQKWLRNAESTMPVPLGEQQRHRDRTLDTLLDLIKQPQEIAERRGH